jgi:dephospho-CoA kinase
MLKVAVTGNMGSGKSLVCRVFETLGVPVFYSDTVAKNLYNYPDILKKMVEKFGERILTSSGILDRKHFASVIFNDREALQYVSSIIHPEVYKLFEKWSLQQQDKPWCIKESALVFETGHYKQFDKIILVYAHDDVLVERVTMRDGSLPDDVRSRLANQLPVESKLALSHYHILNDNSDLILPQLLKINEELNQLAGKL